MRTRHIVGGLAASTVLLLAQPLLAAIQLTPVVSGLASPVFVGHAGDGSNRLFIEEQIGTIKVLQPGASTPTEFLDIRTKVVSGGERGLLGLAFHPQYPLNRRFFVFYTRVGDGTLVIAEYKASSSNPNVADPTETVLLTIAHPNTNHNGGMLAFGPDGYLYIGVGDGGSANDPPNNAQNVDVLLGKILRIDVDQPDAGAGTLYSSPSGNPFRNGPGRDEIFAFGMRNPWRFSFDRLTGQQWVGDVGQGMREEVDTAIVVGGNYGWRIYEGFQCTNNDPTLCIPGNFFAPLFDYAHLNGRCSITGGYVYRGTQGSLSGGTYVYADYCTGEIFTWNGAAQSLALDTALNVSSFGEDEQGELYVVGLGGTVSRIETTSPPCTYSISPSSRSLTSAGGSGSVAVAAGAGCEWTAVSHAPFITVTSGASGSANGTVEYSVDPNTSGTTRSGTIAIADQTFTVTQSAASCTYSITPQKGTFDVAGGSGTVTVTTAPGCSWMAVSNASWIAITGGGSGTGSGVVNYSVSVYTGRPRNRNGTMAIAGLTFSIKQSR